MVQVIGMGCRYFRDKASEATAPVAQTMKIQLDVCAVVRPNCWETPICSGTAPKAYHMNAVSPAHKDAELNSRRILPNIESPNVSSIRVHHGEDQVSYLRGRKCSRPLLRLVLSPRFA